MRSTQSLTDMLSQETGRVRAIQATNPAELYEFLAAGLWQNAQIYVIRNDRRHVLVFAGAREVALDRQAAARVWVESETVR